MLQAPEGEIPPAETREFAAPLTLPEELAGRVVLAAVRQVAPEERERLLRLSGAPGTSGGVEDARRRLAGAVLRFEATATRSDGRLALGPEEAAAAWPRAEEAPPADPDLAIAWRQVAEAVAAAARGESMPPPGEPERQAMRRAIGWYGTVVELWSEPLDSPRRAAMERSLLVTLATIVAAVAWFLGMGVLGAGVLVAAIVLVATGRLRPQVDPVGAGGRFGEVYAETFLLWLLLFSGLQLVIDLVLAERSLLAAGTMMVASLAALAWPRLRGVPAAALAKDLGLWWGRPLWRAPLEGIAAYSLCLPLLLAGVAAAAILGAVLEAAGMPPSPPSHPLQEELSAAGPASSLMLLLLAAAIVPPIEEIMFRGVLYRHLREWFGSWGRVLGIAAAATASSLLFAAIHPQGIAFVPVLASLAVGFCIARELCGSVVPAIIAHGINNGVVVLLNLGLMTG